MKFLPILGFPNSSFLPSLPLLFGSLFLLTLFFALLSIHTLFPSSFRTSLPNLSACLLGVYLVYLITHCLLVYCPGISGINHVKEDMQPPWSNHWSWLTVEIEERPRTCRNRPSHWRGGRQWIWLLEKIWQTSGCSFIAQVMEETKTQGVVVYTNQTGKTDVVKVLCIIKLWLLLVLIEKFFCIRPRRPGRYRRCCLTKNLKIYVVNLNGDVLWNLGI